MCGIFGFMDQQSPLSALQVQAMGQAIAHRGPDDQGVFEAAGVALGNQRLSIVDVAAGHQPFVSQDGQVVVVFNGEIYNHAELRDALAAKEYHCRTHCDTEVILGWYLQEGIDCLQRFNGMFAIAIYDARQSALYLARDRIGIKPLFWAKREAGLLFASEVNSILATGYSRQVDYAGLMDFLQFGFVSPQHSIFEGITQVQPGYWLRLDQDGQIDEQCWWDLATVEQVNATDAQAIATVESLLREAVDTRSRCEVPFGAFLSGGVDSSSVVAMMAEQLDTPIQTFAIGFEDPTYDESGFAAEVAKQFATAHHAQIVGPEMMADWPTAVLHCGQPHGDVSFVPTLQLAKLAHTKVKVVLTGDGGDELFAGYDKYAGLLGNWDTANPVPAMLQAISLFDQAALSQLMHPDLQAQCDVDQSNALLNQLVSEVPEWDPINQMLYVDSKLLLPGNNLVKPDRMGMAVSLEARTPFLDHRLVEYVFSLPGQLKLRDGQTKWVLKEAMRPHLGDALTDRRKQMFTVPIGDWIIQQLQSTVTAILQSERFRDRQWFQPAVVDKMLAEHIAGQANYTRQLRSLVALEYWARSYLDVPVISGGEIH